MCVNILLSNIKILRIKKGISQEKMASELMVEKEKYSDWEEKISRPGIDDLINLMDIHQVTLEELIIKDLSKKTRSSATIVRIRKKVIDEICEYFGFRVSEIKTKTRGKRNKWECRQLIYFFIFKNNLGSLNDIADELGRDHSSVIHGISVVKDLLEVDKHFKTDFTNIEERVKEIIESEKS